MTNFKCINGHETTEVLNENGLCNSCTCMTCKIGNSERSIRCHFCKKWNHYKCSLLSPWYILNYKETGSQYKCINCIKDRVIRTLTEKNKTQEEIKLMINDIENDIENCLSNDSPPVPHSSPTPPSLNPSLSPPLPSSQPAVLHPPTPIPLPQFSHSQPTGPSLPLPPIPIPSFQIPPNNSTPLNVSHVNASQNSIDTRSDTTSTSSNSSLNNTIVEQRNRAPADNEILEEYGGNPPICKYYNKGRCNFRETCSYRHPKLCKYWAKNPINGCLYSREQCRFYHPYECYEYENKKRCEKENCRFFHRKNALNDGPFPVEDYYWREPFTNQRTPLQQAWLEPPPPQRPPPPEINNEREFPEIPGQRRNIRRNARLQSARYENNIHHQHPPQSTNASTGSINSGQEYNPTNTQNGIGARIPLIPDRLTTNQTTPLSIPMQLNTNIQPHPIQQQQQQQHPPQIPLQFMQNPPVQGHFLPLTMLQEMWKILQPLMQTNAIPVGP